MRHVPSNCKIVYIWKYIKYYICNPTRESRFYSDACSKHKHIRREDIQIAGIWCSLLHFKQTDQKYLKFTYHFLKQIDIRCFFLIIYLIRSKLYSDKFDNWHKYINLTFYDSKINMISVVITKISFPRFL